MSDVTAPLDAPPGEPLVDEPNAPAAEEQPGGGSDGSGVRAGSEAGSELTPEVMSEVLDSGLDTRPAQPRVFAVANQKGGVGKTTTAVNLGAALADLGQRVLIVDLDPQGNASTGLGIDPRNFDYSMYDVLLRDVPVDDCIEPTSIKNLFIAPSTLDLAGAEIELVPTLSREFRLRRSLEPIRQDFNYIFIDCPPSLGLITLNALTAASEVLVPIQCEFYALEGVSQLARNVELVRANLNPDLAVTTIVLTMYDARTKLSDSVVEEVRSHFGSVVCRNVIPRTVRISEAPSFGEPVTVHDPNSRGAIAYRELAKEVSGVSS
jgi:chromosome partitioning protein